MKKDRKIKGHPYCWTNQNSQQEVFMKTGRLNRVLLHGFIINHHDARGFFKLEGVDRHFFFFN